MGRNFGLRVGCKLDPRKRTTTLTAHIMVGEISFVPQRHGLLLKSLSKNWICQSNLRFTTHISYGMTSGDNIESVNAIKSEWHVWCIIQLGGWLSGLYRPVRAIVPLHDLCSFIDVGDIGIYAGINLPDADLACGCNDDLCSLKERSGEWTGLTGNSCFAPCHREGNFAYSSFERDQTEHHRPHKAYREPGSFSKSCSCKLLRNILPPHWRHFITKM